MIPHSNYIKDAGRLFFWYPARWFIESMPFAVIYWLGGVVGLCDYFFSGSRRIQRMTRNIAKVFPEKPKRILKNNLKNHSRNVLELIKYPQLNNRNLDSVMTFKGLQHLDAALENGKGVILATGHFGAKQLLQVGLGHKGYRVNQLNHHMSRKDLSYIQKEVSQKHRKRIEQHIPVKFIPTNGFLRSVYSCLKQNEILVIAADGIGIAKHMGKNYIPISFLGSHVLFPSNMVTLAQRTGSPILPIFVIRSNKTKHTIEIGPPLDQSTQSIEEIVTEFAHILEKKILQRPHLWEFWEEFDENVLLHSSHS